MAEWERLELRPLFEKLFKEVKNWEPEKVLPRTEKLGELVKDQLKEYKEGKFRTDRNEAIGFFESISKFADTGLPLSLDHFEGLISQYRERITPYPHYSGIKVTVPVNFENLDKATTADIPTDIADDEDEQGSSLTLM